MCFFCPLSILIILLGEEGAGLCAYRALAMYTLICVTFSLPPAVGAWLRLLLVALPGLVCLPFFYMCTSSWHTSARAEAGLFSSCKSLKAGEVTQLAENVTGTLAFGCKRVWSNLTLHWWNVIVTLAVGCRKVWFDSTLLKPYLDVSPWSHVYVKQTFPQRCKVKYINCRLNLNKRLKTKVPGNIISKQSLQGPCRFYCKISPSNNVQERFWNFCYHVVASYFIWPFCNFVINLFFNFVYFTNYWASK